ncbi:MAG: DUF938 domain-containing protein [Pseudomonadales bacterium]
MDAKPFSQASENNKHAILGVLQELFLDRQKVLEIGSGTGQHACFFAQHLPQLQWQPSDMIDNLPGIRQWRCDADLPNLLEEKPFDVRRDDLPAADSDAVFSANTLHIMAWPEVQTTFRHLAALNSDTKLCIYGPFNYGGEFTSESNARFNDWLLQRNSGSAIRDFEAVNELANDAGFTLGFDYAMPANNRLLSWQKR